MFLLIKKRNYLEYFCFIHAKNIYLGQFNLDIGLFHNILFFCFFITNIKRRNFCMYFKNTCLIFEIAF